MQRARSKDREERKEERIKAQVEKLCGSIGVKPIFSGDPRGNVLKISVPKAAHGRYVVIEWEPGTPALQWFEKFSTWVNCLSYAKRARFAHAQGKKPTTEQTRRAGGA